MLASLTPGDAACVGLHDVRWTQGAHQGGAGTLEGDYFPKRFGSLEEP